MGKVRARLLLLVLALFGVGVNAAHTKTYVIEKSKAEAIQLPQGVTEVFVAHPEIADVQMSNPKLVYVFGVAPGQTTLFASNAQGKLVMSAEIHVTHAMKDMKKVLRQSYPQQQVKTTSTPDAVLLEGEVTSGLDAADMEETVGQYTRQRVMNRLRVTTPQQVILKVKIAEVSRSALEEIGINWSNLARVHKNALTGQKFSIGLFNGRDTLGSANPTQGNGGSLGVRFNDGTSNVGAILDALSSEGLGTILAEPNLVALSGQTASFLSGGEFPYPVRQDDTVTIQFQPFGIGLEFTPTVLADGRIHMRVRPEVSELDFENAINYGDGSVPGLKTRRAETSVELGSGQSIAIAGLLSDAASNTLSALPGAGDIPILGALFRSTKFQRRQTEVVIVVTPYLVDPAESEKALKLPTDNLPMASSLEALFLNVLNRDPGQPADPAMRFQGSAGFHVPQ
ncbi:MAG: type II and III secretion system protein family protein [Holosporales bacterium]